MLDPNLGRWTRQDPLGYVDGANAYQSYLSKPAGLVDSQGVRTQDPRDYDPKWNCDQYANEGEMLVPNAINSGVFTVDEVNGKRYLEPENNDRFTCGLAKAVSDKNYEMIDCDRDCPPGTYKVLVLTYEWIDPIWTWAVSSTRDYHVLVQTSDGGWASKPGTRAARREAGPDYPFAFGSKYRKPKIVGCYCRPGTAPTAPGSTPASSRPALTSNTSGS